MSKEILRDAFAFVSELFGDLPYTAEDRFYDLLNKISIAVVEYRIAHDMSQSQLAEKLGVSQAMVSKYESGDYNFSLKTLIDLFDKLDIPLSFSLGSESVSSFTSADYLRYSIEQNSSADTDSRSCGTVQFGTPSKNLDGEESKPCLGLPETYGAA